MDLNATEQERLLASSELISQKSLGSGRWTEHMASTVRAADGKYYRISWQRGLTEYQEDEYEDGEVLEVFPVESLKVKSKTLYLTQSELDEVRPTLAHKLLDDADSYAIATGKQLRSTLTEKIYSAAAELREHIEDLAPLDLAGESGDYREAATQYLDALIELWERGSDGR